MPERERIVAVGLLTQSDLDRLGAGFARDYPVTETPCFGELLTAIDEADRDMRAGRTISLPRMRER
ncbi:MAG: hypothetical protein EOO80_06760 [Oxalobacteraceae bacterium]|nr:MAG: hypothetical protein EOO80_06760 [Oxalobacteraceae bacterium]